MDTQVTDDLLNAVAAGTALPGGQPSHTVGAGPPKDEAVLFQAGRCVRHGTVDEVLPADRPRREAVAAPSVQVGR
ncbi:hypothetical protein KVH22_29050 [Streptomyces olivaceus]|uniref:hypothetical protein n=1 Tax=Streptomyces TaxID=1883 RepID=UPI001CCDA3DC|nr:MULTISPECIES: hypothetical protein [Streptomyces]MBZ6141435.1 hypothetical protein [Streptomyces olivaceus]MBZ6169199.1 hypothetical protein [Streptomyces olivaceus]MBZ6176234.1 hypothetical protein [Streptomyces olivaceus]MBZ6182566.1 hypothetical protein [Streptomyces olivaceus]MBZ6259567.1 hypothetical protein [Streptomyces olivaceus]